MYAVSDTRYLIRLTYELMSDLSNYYQTINQNVDDVFAEIQKTCKTLSLSKYEKPNIFPKSFTKLVEQVEQRYSPLQLQVLHAVWVI